ncbi:MAG: Uma2 family endonuclease [Geitlerinemataceae cyanobacterium]
MALRLQVTLEQLKVLAAHNRNLRLELSAKGELLVNPPTGWETGERNMDISLQLGIWWRGAGKPGKVFDSSTGFTMPSGAVLSPDASWVSADRWAKLTDPRSQTFATVCPDFVVELRSASDSLRVLQAKMGEYIENGARLGWAIDPQRQTVEIYRPDREVETRQKPASISGESVLLGFTLDLADIWG